MLLGEDDDAGELSDDPLIGLPEDEEQLIDEFLDKFVFLTESTSRKETIDLNLALKALPLKVDEGNIYRIDLISFKVI